MADVDWTDGGLRLYGVPTEAFQRSLKDHGYADFQIAGLLSSALAGVAWAQPVAFKFSTAVEPTDPSCQVTYRRTFEHDDWADGRSRVQAGTTPDEVGFNARFHALEHELDAVATQFTGLGRCVAGLREDLHGVVRELENEITSLRLAVAGVRREQSPKLPRLENWATQQKVIGYQTLADGKLKILLQKGEEVMFLDSKEFTASFRQTFDPQRDVKDVAKDLGTYAEAIRKDKALARRVAFGVTKQDLIEEMGGRLLDVSGHGITVAELLVDVPDSATFKDVVGLTDAVTTAAIGRTGDGNVGQVRAEVLAPALQGASAATVRDAKVDGLATVTPAVSEVLHATGFTTIGSVAAVTATDLVGAASKAGLDLSLAQANSVVGGALMGITVVGLR